MEQFDKSKHKMVDFRNVGSGERYVANDGVVYIADHDIAEYLYPIVVPIVTDLAWAVAQMVREPGVEYTREESHLVSRYDKEAGFQYRTKGGEKWADCGSFCDKEVTSTTWHRLSSDGRDWLRSLPDDSEVVNKKLGITRTKCGPYLEYRGDDGYVGHRDRIDDVADSGWSLRPKPAAGSREEVIASSVGSCWWLNPDRGIFRKKIGDGKYATIDTITGAMLGGFNEEHLAAIGYVRILSLSGQPAEPVVGSRTWAMVVTKELGHKVTHPRMTGEYEFYDSGKKCFMRHMQYGVDYSTTFMMITKTAEFDSGWSLYVLPAPVPTVDSLAAEVRELRETVAALEAKGVE